MPVSKEIIKFLDDKKIKYELIEHRIVFSAFDKAATLKAIPAMVGKTLTLKLGKVYALVLIGADRLLDKVKFKKTADSWLKKNNQKPEKSIDFVKENWLKKNLKEVQAGSIPPFGAIWGLPTFLDKTLLKNKKIIVNAGEYNLSFKITPGDLNRIENLVIADFSEKKPIKKAKKKPKKIVKKKSKKSGKK